MVGEWQPPFGAAEGRNAAARDADAPGGAWQLPSGAAEDRNTVCTLNSSGSYGWQPPSGAAEDRNDFVPADGTEAPEVAAALRIG